ncbi:hypothetical protein [Nocardioides montaniterrae]
MTGKHGAVLGADLGALWHAGKHDLHLVAVDYGTAWSDIPVSISGFCRRGNGIGSDPGASLDNMLDRVNKMLLDTQTAVTAVGAALVWVADEYAATDASCRDAFNAKKKSLQEDD